MADERELSSLSRFPSVTRYNGLAVLRWTCRREKFKFAVSGGFNGLDYCGIYYAGAAWHFLFLLFFSLFSPRTRSRRNVTNTGANFATFTFVAKRETKNEKWYTRCIIFTQTEFQRCNREEYSTRPIEWFTVTCFRTCKMIPGQLFVQSNFNIESVERICETHGAILSRWCFTNSLKNFPIATLTS